MGLNNVSSSGEDAVFTDIEAESLGLPSGYTINEDNGDLVVRDTTGTVALRRVDGGNWSFAGNTVEANQLGTSANPATVESDQITNSGQVTTQDLTVNGAVSGVGGGIELEPGDSLSVFSIGRNATSSSFVTLFSGTDATVLGGTISGSAGNDFLYTFNNGSTVHLNGTGTTYTISNRASAKDENGDQHEVTMLPPAKGVDQVDVGTRIFSSAELAAKLVVKQ
jgi:hypothetical protein